MPENSPPKKKAQALNCNQTEKARLASVLKVKLNARIILAVNIDLQDWLINDQIGIIKDYVKFNDAKADLRNDAKAGLKNLGTYRKGRK